MTRKYQQALDRLNSFKKRYGGKIVTIIGKANRFIFLNLTDGMVAGLPQPATINGNKVWSVPILLSAKLGIAAEIGVIFIDDETPEVIGATDSEIVMQNAEAFAYEETELA